MEIRYNKNILGAGLFLALAITLWLLMPYQIVLKTNDIINSQSFPRLVIGIMGLSSFYLFIKEILKIVMGKERNIGTIVIKEECKRLLMIGLVVLFWVLLHFTSFLVSAMVFGTLTLMLFKCKKWPYYLVVNGMVIGVTLLFEHVLYVNLP